MGRSIPTVSRPATTTIDSNCDETRGRLHARRRRLVRDLEWRGRGRSGAAWTSPPRGDLTATAPRRARWRARERRSRQQRAARPTCSLDRSSPGEFDRGSAGCRDLFAGCGFEERPFGRVPRRLDGDKADDIALSAPHLHRVGSDPFGSHLPDQRRVGRRRSWDIAKLAWATLAGGAQYDYAGTDLQRGGDVTGDGRKTCGSGLQEMMTRAPMRARSCSSPVPSRERRPSMRRPPSSCRKERGAARWRDGAGRLRRRRLHDLAVGDAGRRRGRGRGGCRVRRSRTGERRHFRCRAPT